MSLKVLAELPIIVVLMYQLYKQHVHNDVAEFIPLIMNTIVLQPTPQQRSFTFLHKLTDVFVPQSRTVVLNVDTCICWQFLLIYVSYILIDQFIIPLPTRSSGRRYSVFQQKFLSFFSFFFRQRIFEMALLTGNLWDQNLCNGDAHYLTRNFEPSHGICPFPRNFYISAELRRIWYWLVISY